MRAPALGRRSKDGTGGLQSSAVSRWSAVVSRSGRRPEQPFHRVTVGSGPSTDVTHEAVSKHTGFALSLVRGANHVIWLVPLKTFG
jgi:hypothetical protein